jgi:hypothetical protein
MCDLGFALFLALISAGIGVRILKGLREAPEHPLDAVALATPLGLGALALACLLVGEVGWLNLVGLAVLLAVATELGVLASGRLALDLVRRRERGAADQPICRIDRLMKTLLVLTLAATGISSIVPVTDGDALCYHLQVPKIFLIRQSVFFDPDLHETVYPLVTELLYALALEFRGPVACRCLQWILGLVFAANVTALARPSLGTRAWWAGTVALLVPAVTNGMAAPLNDVALAAFGASAIVAWTRMLEKPSLQTALLAGAMSGLAAGVKYPALVLVGLLTVLTLLRPLMDRSWRSRRGWMRSVELAMGFSGMVMLVAGGWYLRAYVHTGNPVYPFFKDFFGGAGLDEVLAPIKKPLEASFWNLLTAIIPISLEPHRFDSFAHQFGPIFLLFLPALLIVRAPRRVMGLVALGYLFLILCLTQRQSMRFLLIAVGPMSVGVAYLATRWRETRTMPARALSALLVLVLVMETGLAMTRAGRALGTVLGSESFHEFLRRSEPTYKVGRWVARHLPAGARLIGQDHRGFYIPRWYTMELAHRRRTGLGQNGESPREIVDALKKEGYTHLMMSPPAEESTVEFDPTLCRLLAPWLAARTPVYQEDLKDSDGVMRKYSIYELRDESLGTRKDESIRR